ncbi:DUF1559 family PulG-like putative transporter [Adhaeretor mobilis]|uniref:DUF1559 domain-containing protein n=1 Tax=Adhaeretor mobilis TaxID=1930276 RepID=A0A517MWH3_9BACT|nr:DUF1559 domain-containing protein [Adhaeretor mobilis]QDS99230.1 hypothetical protein HG15A2_25220 [Adhaeretor mobilis]
MNDEKTEPLDSPVPEEERFSKSTLISAGGIVVIICGVLAFLVSNARHAVHETLCHASLFKLRHALLEYDSVYGSLPPPFLQGPDGNAAHSWRVLILPHLDSLGIDGDGIYEAYDMTDPWNGSRNQRLFQPVSESRFACPCGLEDGTTLTSYVVLVGEDTLFPGDQTISVSVIPDTSDPILVLEITNSDIEWAEPRDLSIHELKSTSGVNFLELTRPHAGSIRFITLSGKLGVLPAGTNLEEVRRLASINGQTAEDTEEFQ